MITVPCITQQITKTIHGCGVQASYQDKLMPWSRHQSMEQAGHFSSLFFNVLQA